MDSRDGYDPVMLELFRAEMDTHVPVLSHGLLALEKGQGDEKDFESMMRAAHSIKGAARIVGIEAAVRVAHAMEDCFSAAQGHRIVLSSEAVDALLEGVDALQRICSPQADSASTEDSIQPLLAQFAAIREGKSPAPSLEPVSMAPGGLAQPELPATLEEESVTLAAVLDASVAESLRVELMEVLRRHPSRIRLDFSPVMHLSAAALSLLASFAREISHGDPVPVVQAEGVSAAVADLLRATGLNSTFAQKQ